MSDETCYNPQLCHSTIPFYCVIKMLIFSVLVVFIQFSSVTQSCPTLCDPMDCSIPGFPVHHLMPGTYSNSCPLSWWCHPTISASVFPFSSCLQFFPASGSFPMSQFFASGGQSIRASASASVLPMSIQDWFPLGWTDLISLLSKGLSRVFSNTKASILWHFSFPTLTSIRDYWKNNSIWLNGPLLAK